jgi:hypothetical protein
VKARLDRAAHALGRVIARQAVGGKNRAVLVSDERRARLAFLAETARAGVAAGGERPVSLTGADREVLARVNGLAAIARARLASRAEADPAEGGE